MAVEARAPCGDGDIIIIVILIKITDFIFMTVFPEIEYIHYEAHGLSYGNRKQF
jgi:hypothetical protein